MATAYQPNVSCAAHVHRTDAFFALVFKVPLRATPSSVCVTAPLRGWASLPTLVVRSSHEELPRLQRGLALVEPVGRKHLAARPPDRERSSVGTRRGGLRLHFALSPAEPCLLAGVKPRVHTRCSVARRRRGRSRHAHRIPAGSIVSVRWRFPGGVERCQFRLAYRP
jgi:hypothetical protein